MPEQFLIAATGPNLYSVSPSGTQTQIGSGLAADSRWEWVKAPAIGGQGPFYGSNGVTPYQWTGTGNAAAWTATVVDATHVQVPAARYLLYHGNRVWAAGMTADPSAVRSSNIGDPRDWPLDNIWRFDAQDGEAISGIGVAGPYVLVFKPSKIWLITNLDLGDNRPVSRNIGAVAHRTIAATPYGTLFLSPRDGVMMANHNNTQLLSNNERVSDAIRASIQALPATQLHHATAIYFDHHYYLSVIAPNNARRLYDYDMRLRSWWMHTLGATQMVAWDPSADGSAGLRIYAGMRDSGQIRRLLVPGVTTDVGQAFESLWHGPFHTFGRPSLRKRCREFQVDGTGLVSVALSKDYVQSTTEVGSGFGGTQLVRNSRIYTPGVARSWSVRFANFVSTSFTINSYTMAMQERQD